jgi:hypothetical protein
MKLQLDVFYLLYLEAVLRNLFLTSQKETFMMVLIKLPEYIPEIQENNLLQTYTVNVGNNYDSNDQ